MAGSNQMLFFFSALGAFNGLLLSVYFALKANRNKFSNYFLALLLFVLSVRIIKSVFFYFNPHLSNAFIQIGLSACILIGPFLFLYLKTYTNGGKSNWAIHVIPCLVAVSVLGAFYPYVEYSEMWSTWIVKGIYVQWLIYIAVSLRFILPVLRKIKGKGNFKNLDLWLLSIYAGVFVIWLAYSIGAYTSYIVGALSFSFVLYLIVLLFVFRISKESTFFQQKEKYKDKKMDAETLKQIERTFPVIAEKQLFLNPNLTLAETAKEMNVSAHALSQYLNEELGKSFSTLISEYRVEKAKTLLQSQKNYTVESSGYDSGFSSKSTFFTTFKKLTGKTPAEYQKMNQK